MSPQGAAAMPWDDGRRAERKDQWTIYDPGERYALLNCITEENDKPLSLHDDTRRRLDVARETDPEGRRRITRVWQELIMLWPDADYVMNFMFREHPMLGDWRPVDCILGGQTGADAVLSVAHRAQFSSAA